MRIVWNAARLVCFFFNDTATTEISTLPLPDALPICGGSREPAGRPDDRGPAGADRQLEREPGPLQADRKSTRLNSSHANISYAVFCLKKKKQRRPAKPVFQRVYSLTHLLSSTTIGAS